MPLRDAVEKRPPPDEAFDLELDLPDNYNVHKNAIPIPFQEHDKFSVLQSYITPQGHVSSQGFFRAPQKSQYSSIYHLQSIVAALREKYGHGSELVPYGALRRGRVFENNPFLNKEIKKNQGVLGMIRERLDVTGS